MVLYDVGSGWDGSYVSQMEGPGWHGSITSTGPKTTVDDDPNLVDVKFAYVGVVPITTDTTFGGFSIVSTATEPALGDYAAGRFVGGVHSVGRVAVPTVPEPASLTSCVLGAGVLLRRRRRSSNRPYA